MDIQQLKLLAGRVRGLLQHSHHPIGHSQSLDLVAALPGLRNWPEIQAFPDRVATCELDRVSAGRLAFRIKRKFRLDLTPENLLVALSPPGAEQVRRAPEVWPTGPIPGVYVTASQSAINALLDRYEEATDGALVYAEQAGYHGDNSIDLGEAGLWSSGMQRVPSGTLLVVGPLALDQESWDESAGHLEMACLHAQRSHHRVAVLLKTPDPKAMCEDVHLMVRSTQSAGNDPHTALFGVVTEEGELQRRTPFAHSRARPVQIRSVATVKAIPPAARPALRKALAERNVGLLLLGSAIKQEHEAIDLVAASLSLTEHAGPAARIMPRHRGTPAKDWQVPEAIKQLPFLPSIESAYEQGYRRLIFDPHSTPGRLLLKFSQDTLFIAGHYGNEVGGIFLGATRASSSEEEGQLLERVIAILGVTPVPTKRGEVVASDLYVMQENSASHSMKLEDILKFLQERRLLRWEDEVGPLLDSVEISVADLEAALPRVRSVMEFLSRRAAAEERR